MEKMVFLFCHSPACSAIDGHTMLQLRPCSCCCCCCCCCYCEWFSLLEIPFSRTNQRYLDFMFQYAKERAHEQIPKHAYTPSAVKVCVRALVCVYVTACISHHLTLVFSRWNGSWTRSCARPSFARVSSSPPLRNRSRSRSDWLLTRVCHYC